jgi:hypothetical protein
MRWSYQAGGRLERRFWQLLDRAPTSLEMLRVLKRFDRALRKQRSRILEDLHLGRETKLRRLIFLQIAYRWIHQKTRSEFNRRKADDELLNSVA